MDKSDKIKTTISYLDREIYELAKAFLKSNYNTHYGNLGDFISFCIKHTLESVFDVRDFKDVNNGSKSKFPDLIQGNTNRFRDKKRQIIKRLCNEFSHFEEDTYSVSTVRNVILRVLSEFGHVAPSKQTVYNYINFFLASKALLKDWRSGGYKVKPERFKQIIEEI